MSTYHSAERQRLNNTKDLRQTYYGVFGLGTDKARRYTTVKAMSKTDAERQFYELYGHNIVKVMREQDWRKKEPVYKIQGFEVLE